MRGRKRGKKSLKKRKRGRDGGKAGQGISFPVTILTYLAEAGKGEKKKEKGKKKKKKRERYTRFFSTSPRHERGGGEKKRGNGVAHL